GAPGRDPPRRRQSVPRRAAAAGGDRAQAGRRPPDPHRDRSRRAGAVRPAAAWQELRQAVPGFVATVPEDPRRGRRGGILRPVGRGYAPDAGRSPMTHAMRRSRASRSSRVDAMRSTSGFAGVGGVAPTYGERVRLLPIPTPDPRPT